MSWEQFSEDYKARERRNEYERQEIERAYAHMIACCLKWANQLRELGLETSNTQAGGCVQIVFNRGDPNIQVQGYCLKPVFYNSTSSNERYLAILGTDPRGNSIGARRFSGFEELLEFIFRTTLIPELTN